MIKSQEDFFYVEKGGKDENTKTKSTRVDMLLTITISKKEEDES
jgi:hypothetical protein